MSPELLTWLRELDVSGGYAPKDFDYTKAMKEVEKVRPVIEQILDETLHLQWEQDMACLATLGVFSEVYRDPATGWNTQRNLICIRFCSFGRLVTVDGEELKKWEPKLNALYDFLQKENFVFVPREHLDEPYSGGEPYGEGRWTWFSRFFDYL